MSPKDQVAFLGDEFRSISSKWIFETERDILEWNPVFIVLFTGSRCYCLFSSFDFRKKNILNLNLTLDMIGNLMRDSLVYYVQFFFAQTNAHLHQFKSVKPDGLPPFVAYSPFYKGSSCIVDPSSYKSRSWITQIIFVHPTLAGTISSRT